MRVQIKVQMKVNKNDKIVMEKNLCYLIWRLSSKAKQRKYELLLKEAGKKVSERSYFWQNMEQEKTP